MSKETILIVDDNRQIADLFAFKLLPDLNYETLVAYDGKSGLELLKSNPVDLMLLDLELPDTTGLQMLRQLHGTGHNIPTILVTAHGSEEVAVDAFRLGVVDYLTKPVDIDTLNSSIARSLTETRLSREKAKLTNQLKEQVSWLTVLSKVGQILTSTLELDEVLRRIVEAGVHLTRAEEGFLALLDEQNGQLYMRAVKNIDESKIKTMHLPVSDSLVGTVIRTGRPMRTTQSIADPPLKVSTGFLVHSLLHVPILSKGKAHGVLSVVNNRYKMAFKESDEFLLTSLADYAAIALENAGLFQQAQQEISERKRVEQALRVSEERYALAIRGANDGLWDWDLKSDRIYFSPRWKSMLGFSEEEIENLPQEWYKRIHPEDIERVKLDLSAHLNGVTAQFQNEHRMRHKDGDYRWMLSRGLAVRDAEDLVYRMAGSQTDITDRKNAEEKLLHNAFYDILTGLPNRALFMDRLHYAIERSKRRKDYQFAVLFMDLDRFKNINDSLGHITGDQLLVSIASKLSSGLRATDTVARFGGDEFVILLEDINDISIATRIASMIQNKLSASFNISGHEVFITTSIGIVLSSLGYHQSEDVVRDADIAMYTAKANGKNRYEIFDPTMRERIVERLELETELRQAFEQRKLIIHYQPIVSLKTGQINGFEALVRWNHPTRGILAPAEFIPMAEETGMIISIDRWVLREACRQMRLWQEQFPLIPPLTVSVNLSGNQVAQPDLVEQIELILRETGLEARYLKLEITESTIMENNALTSEMFRRLRNLGVEVQIDDFGTGYSSLGYLHQFPVSALKIDRSFVSRMDPTSNNMEIAQTVVILAHDLGMETVAEGVETEQQLDQLKALSCEYGQGFLVSKPLSPEDVNILLANILLGNNPFSPWKDIQP